MSSTQRGSITLIIGCMFSSKTKTLSSAVDRHFYGKRKCMIVKHSDDDRYDHLAKNGGIVFNDGVENSKFDVYTASKLGFLSEIVKLYDVVGITESQFFSDLLIVDDWANAGKIIICDGLSGDAKRETFGDVLNLIPKCETVISLRAVCYNCGYDASFTRKIAGTAEQKEAGGYDKYRPVCRECYNGRNPIG